MATLKTFADRLTNACDRDVSIPAMYENEGRLNYLREKLLKQGVAVTNQSLSRWFSGAAIPRDKHLVPLAQLLNVTPDWLRYGDKAAELSSEHRQTYRPVAHKFRLRPDLEIELVLPEDLSTKEADRLARFVSSLPIQT